jgi:hypothetical protein
MSKRLGHNSNGVSVVSQASPLSHVDMDYGKNP